MVGLSQDMLIVLIATLAGVSAVLGMLLVIRTMRSDNVVVAKRLTAISTSGLTPDEEKDDGVPLPRFIVTLLTRAGMPVNAGRIWLFMALVVLLGMAAMAVGAWRLAPMILFLPPMIALFYLQRRARKRFLAFADALPTVIDRIRQLVLIGNNLHQALIKGVDASAPEMRTLLQPLVWRLRHGSSVPDAVSWYARRMDMGELHLLSAAIATNFRFGGRITDILGSLIGTLRSRQKLLRELRASTSEARATGLVLGMLSPTVAILLYSLNPSFMEFYLTDRSGPMLLAIIAGIQIVGVTLMVRTLKVEF